MRPTREVAGKRRHAKIGQLRQCTYLPYGEAGRPRGLLRLLNSGRAGKARQRSRLFNGQKKAPAETGASCLL